MVHGIGEVAEQPIETWPPLQVRVLGPFEVHRGDVLVDLGSPKQRALFLVLLLQRGRVVSTDRLIDLLWGERPPRGAGHSLQTYVSDLRRRIVAAGGGPTIVTRRPGYLIEADAVEVDVDRFEELARRGRALLGADAAGAVGLLEAGLGLWRGEPLHDLVFEEFAGTQARAWQDLRIGVFEDLASALLEKGDLAREVTVAEAAIQLDSLRERSRELLMLGLYRSGRVADALHAFTRFRRLLIDELGIEPSPALQRLQERILLNDPDLLPGLTPVAQIGGRRRNPFKGLRPFAEDDAEDFFGRDRLIQQILERLAGGDRLVAVVGPSGSGKSSVVAAGILPQLRAGALPGSAGWSIIEYPAGEHVVADLEAALARAFSDAGPGLSPVSNAGRAVLVMDQFEEGFIASTEDAQRRFLDRLCAAISQPTLDLTVILTLRADLYDRPLRHPAFAELFVQGVVNVLPMSTEEIEAAVVSPAERAGATVEPALLAELAADTADRPGLLPLLQYALTELYDGSHGARLQLADYRAIGGIRQALTRRAEQLRLDWDEAEQAVATQLLLRLVRLIDRDRVGRLRLPVADLVAVHGIDPVVVSAVLEDLARLRLISLDRDLPEGPATVEVAHESLFEEWAWLKDLVERHRAALRRHASLRLAVDEWDAADRSPAYLLGSGRLAEVREWRRDGILQLTHREITFLDACEQQAAAEEQARHSREEAQRGLQRKARRRTWFAVVSGAALAVVVALALLLDGSQPPRVAYVHHGVGFIERLIENGLDRAAAETSLTLVQSATDVPHAESETLRLAEAGQDLIVVATNETDLAPVAARFPDTHFVLFQDEVAGDNITNVEFADQETAFLAGAAAALVSKTGHVGFIGGVNTPLLLRFEAGFVAGAEAVDPGVRVDVVYASLLPNYDGFVQPASTERVARPVLAAGADVLFVPAGAAQFGAFQAVIDMSEETGRHLWAIGADEDAFVQDGWQRTAESRNHVLTSTIKRFDVAAYDVVRDHLDHRLEAGSRVYDVGNGGLELAVSGGFLHAHSTRLTDLQEGIVSGRIVVPCVPRGLGGDDAAAAAAGPNCP